MRRPVFKSRRVTRKTRTARRPLSTAGAAILGMAPRIGLNAANRLGGSATVTRTLTRRRRNPEGPTSSPVSYKTVTLGRPERHSLTAAWKHITASDEKVYYRYQGLTDYAQPLGWFVMDRAYGGVQIPTVNGSANLPLYLFDLTCLPTNGAASQQTSVGSRLQLKTPVSSGNADYVFFNTLGQTASGASQGGTLASDQFVADNLGVVQTGPGRMDMLKWLDIRLICVGAAAVPTTFEISLVQFRDEWLHPGWGSQANVSQMDNITWKSLRNAFWENEIQRYTSSPITVMNPIKQRGIKRLYKTSFTIQPKETTSTMTEGAHKIVKLFKHMNKLQRYDWAQAGIIPSNLNPQGTNPGSWPISDSSVNSTDVHPRDRVYLMVKATNQSPGDTGTVASPSFDLVIRKLHVQPSTA